jgi:hypothetical protein
MTPVRVQIPKTGKMPDYDANLGSRGASWPYDTNLGKSSCDLPELVLQPTRSQRYDHSSVIGLQITMSVPDEPSKLYDISSGQSTMTIKSVTDKLAAQTALARGERFTLQLLILPKKQGVFRQKAILRTDP